MHLKKKRLFFSYGKNFSYELKNNKEIKLNCKKLSKKDEIVAVSYSDNLKPEISKIHKKFGVTKHVKMKSSYKFCVIATGEYDIYVAEPRASEWDIAAAHAILSAAGGELLTLSGDQFLYNKESLLNPDFVAVADAGLKWRDQISQSGLAELY